jgi:hypothetical protein
MWSPESLEEHENKDRKTLEYLTVPAREMDSLRATMETHLTRLLNDFNEELAAQIHYLQTGDIIDDRIRDWCPFAPRDDHKEVVKRIGWLKQRAIDLNYVLHSVDEIGQYTELSELNDIQFIGVYNRLLIELKNRRLPEFIG